MIANCAQLGLLEPLSPHARHMFFEVVELPKLIEALSTLSDMVDGSRLVTGIGTPTALALDADIPGLRSFPAMAGAGIAVPSTQAALWCWLRDEDRGDIVTRALALTQALAPSFRLIQSVDCFVHAGGRDLTGYEDGTENPRGNDAREVALLRNSNSALDASSFVALQQWRHDMGRFAAMAPTAQDEAIGRRRADNQELDDAPAAAHVKRTAQEGFDPAAFVLRRSMPWCTDAEAGLMFVAFAHSFDAFEAQLRRMVGSDDGICDALFQFTRPISGSYFWCPGMREGKLDLRALTT